MVSRHYQILVYTPKKNINKYKNLIFFWLKHHFAVEAHGFPQKKSPPWAGKLHWWASVPSAGDTWPPGAAGAAGWSTWMDSKMDQYHGNIMGISWKYPWETWWNHGFPVFFSRQSLDGHHFEHMALGDCHEKSLCCWWNRRILAHGIFRYSWDIQHGLLGFSKSQYIYWYLMIGILKTNFHRYWDTVMGYSSRSIICLGYPIGVFHWDSNIPCWLGSLNPPIRCSQVPSPPGPWSCGQTFLHT